MQTTNQATIINDNDDNDSLPDIDMVVASKEPSILYSFLPGSFEVILCVDYCEQNKK
jgi:hypothetical protein